MIILDGKIDSMDSTSDDKSLPKPQPGMAVSYDGTGEPVFIKINGEPYSESKKNGKTTNGMLKIYNSCHQRE